MTTRRRRCEPIRVLHRPALEHLFAALAAQIGEPAEVTICGGAWMAMADLRLSSLDVDCLGPIPEPLATAAAHLAGPLGLPGGWLNNAATPWAPANSTPTVLHRVGQLTIWGLDPAAVFSMKVERSAPVDMTDLGLLWPLTGHSSVAVAAEAFYDAYPDGVPDPHLGDHIANIVGR